MFRTKELTNWSKDLPRVPIKIALSFWMYGVIATFLVLNIPAKFHPLLRLLGLFGLLQRAQEWLLQFFAARYLS